jgi:hypothetical protein
MVRAQATSRAFEACRRLVAGDLAAVPELARFNRALLRDPPSAPPHLWQREWWLPPGEPRVWDAEFWGRPS